MANSKVTWIDGMAFEAHLDGHTFILDADGAVGGKDRGPKPKGLVLTSVAGCTSMDVISILTKMKVKPDQYEVDVDGDLTDTHPKKFTAVRIRHIFKGAELMEDIARIRKACLLSFDRYCGVIATLKPVADVSYTIEINGEVVPNAAD